ncbi:MAG: FAD-dependent oxidoreductase, partial [Tepidiformaceae bacterium]
MNLAEAAGGEPFDLVVIGGGINGCAIAEEAAARGLRTALFEATDFGFGTTWRSTKLIHGGLRYLEHGDVRLVFESLRERAWLLRTRPYLVKPQRFVLPMLPWTRRPKWQLGVGLSAYDLLALYRGVPAHRRLSDRTLHEMAPFLPDETSGGFTFYDARVIAPERLCLE